MQYIYDRSISHKQNYDAYLRSEAWEEKRLAAMERAGHKCQVCSSCDKLSAHHNSYKHLFDEPMVDLCVLCQTCHMRHHGDEIRQKRKLMLDRMTDKQRAEFHRKRIAKQKKLSKGYQPLQVRDMNRNQPPELPPLKSYKHRQKIVGIMNRLPDINPPSYGKRV